MTDPTIDGKLNFVFNIVRSTDVVAVRCEHRCRLIMMVEAKASYIQKFVHDKFNRKNLQRFLALHINLLI